MVDMNQSVVQNSSMDEEGEITLVAGRIILVFYCLIFVFGLIGNSMVIIVAIRKKNYRNVTNCHVINLAIADLAFLTLSIPYTTYLGVKNTYPFGTIVCKIYTYLAYGFLQATCNIIAVMSVDRYLYIVRPKSKLRWRTPRNAFVICIVIWASSLILIVPYYIVSRVLSPGHSACGRNEHENLIVCLFPFCSYYAIPLIIIIVCYTNLALFVVKTGRQMADHMDTERFHRTVQLKQKRVTRMVIAMTLAFAICWLPIHILELMRCTHPAFLHALIVSYPKVLYSIRACTHALAYFNSCLNPYLYALLNRNFCIDLVGIIPSSRQCCKHSQTVKNGHVYSRSKVSRRILSPNDDDHHLHTTTNDVSCQVELISRTSQEFTSFHTSHPN